MARTTHGARIAVALLAAAFGPAVLAAQAGGQPYRVTDLTPPGLPAGVGADIRNVTPDGREAVGFEVAAGSAITRAARWDLAAGGAYTLLAPAGYRDSSATGAAGGRQFGFAFHIAARTYHAAMWSGTAQSFVSIHPPDAFHSA